MVWGEIAIGPHKQSIGRNKVICEPPGSVGPVLLLPGSNLDNPVAHTVSIYGCRLYPGNRRTVDRALMEFIKVLGLQSSSNEVSEGGNITKSPVHIEYHGLWPMQSTVHN